MNPSMVSEPVSFLHARHEKSAAVLVAMARVLREREDPDPGIREFLQLYQWLSSLPDDVFNAVWQDPASYHWAVICYELMMAEAGGVQLSELAARYSEAVAPGNLQSASQRCLAEIRLFVAACALLAHRNVLFDQPLRLELPRALPGSGYSLQGSGAIQLHGVIDGCLRVAAPDGRLMDLGPEQSLEFVALQRDPEVSHGGVMLRLQPAMFNLPTLEPDFGPIRELSRDTQAGAVERLRQALEYIEKYAPDVFSALRERAVILAVKYHDMGDYSNVSHSILPGAFLLSFVDNTPELADAIIHELHHSLLFALEEDGAFMQIGQHDPKNDFLFYSPWRDDPRPLYGILHALYVFLPVARYWLELHHDTTQPESLRTYALSQLHGITLRQMIAADELERHAVFVPKGQQLFERLCDASRELRVTAEAIAPASQVPALICLTDGRIEARYDSANQQPLTVLDWVRQHARVHGTDNAVAVLADAVA